MIELTQKQSEAKEDWARPELREILYDGGRRSGKTYLIMLAILERAYAFPNSRHLICRLHRTDLERNLYKQTIIPILRDTGLNDKCKVNENKFIITFGNGAEIFLCGLDDKERTEAVIFGSEYSTIFINEVTQISFGTYEDVKSSLSQKVEGLNNLLVADTNPRSARHWAHDYFIVKKNPVDQKYVGDHVYRRGPWLPESNTFLDTHYIEMNLETLSGAKKKRLRHGLWVNLDGLAYPDFEDCIIDNMKIPEEWPRYACIDFGLKHKYAVVWWAHDMENERFIQYAEFGASGRTQASIIPDIREELDKCDEIITDHNPGYREGLDAMGLETEKAVKDVQATYDAFVSLQRGDGGLNYYILKKCIGTIGEMAELELDPKKGTPRKAEGVADDFADDNRYLALRHNKEVTPVQMTTL